LTCCETTTDGAAASGGGPQLDVRRLLPAGPGSVAPANLGIASVNSGGVTYIAPTSSATLLDSTERQQWASGVGAGSTAGTRNNVQVWSRGAFGGFTMRWVFRAATFVSGHRWYVGLRGATAVIGAVNPSTLTDIVGVGFDIAASQWSSLHNDAAGAAVATPLGAAFNVATTDLLELVISAERAGAAFELALHNLTSVQTTGVLTFTTEIPAATTLLSTNVWANTGTDATTSATIQVAEIEVQTERLAA
jgi:hypothetical protein